MSAIQPHDVLVYAGGDAWQRFGTFTRKTQRLARFGESQAEIFARADATTCATFLGRDGLVHFAQANVIRPHWIDTNGDGIPDTLTFLAEPQVTNRLLQSQAWATAPWGNNVVTATNNFATAPDGSLTATKLLPNNTGANNNPYATQGAIAITSGEFIAASVFLKANGYNGIVLRFADSTSTNGFQISFDLGNGVFGTLANGFGAGVLTGKTFINLGGGYYWVGIWGQVNGGVVTGQLFNYIYDTVAHANTQTPYTADGASSVLAWGAQVERNGTSPQAPTSYVPTGAATVTRAGDSCALTIPNDTGPLSIYAKFVERGAVAIPGGITRVCEISKFGANPRLLLYATGGVYNCSLVNASGAQNGSSAAAAPAFGNIVELVGTYDAVGTITITQAINGVAAATVTSASTPPGSPTWGTSTVGLFMAGDPTSHSPAPGAVIRTVVAQGVHTLAEFQALP